MKSVTKIAGLGVVCFLSFCPTLSAFEGSGTPDEPYQISTVADWQTLASQNGYWSKCYLLTNDIDFGGANPARVGTDSIGFTGTFDGNGHHISNAVITLASNNYVGLFSFVDSGGQIQNLSVDSVAVTGNYYVGGLCGANSGTISGCHATGLVTGTGGNFSLGGLCGGNYGTISNCYATCPVTGGYGSHYLGGLCGTNSGTISNCYATGSVTGGDSSQRLGGLCGYSYSAGTITDCYATGTVTGGHSSQYLGGLCGYTSGTINDCCATGSVTGGDGSSYLGGLCGLDYSGSISVCYATGPVTGTSYVGGLCGGGGTITDCYAMGAVSGTDQVGGLVGSCPGKVTNCYSTGRVRGTTPNKGGLCGSAQGGGLSSTDNFWNTETSQIDTSMIGTPETTDNMQTVLTFTTNGVDWDFINTWWMPAVYYPRLRSAPVVNSAPFIAEDDPQTPTMDEDGSPAGWPGLTLHATDADGDSLTWSISNQASHGTAGVVGSNTSATVSYSPNPNWNPSDSFVVEVSDGTLTHTITVNVTINPRNDPPVNTALPTISGTPHAEKTLTANHGTWNDNVDRTPGTITYAYQWQRADNASGLNLVDRPGATGSTYVVQGADNGKYLRVEVTATDNGEGLPASQSVVASSAFVQVTNSAPVIAESDPQTRTMDEDGSPAGWPGLTLHATDADGDSLTWSISSQASHGTAGVVDSNTSAAVSYVPNANWNGSDSFAVQVSDGTLTDAITINVTVNPRNDPPANTVPPTVSGTAHVWKTLTANHGTWNDSADRTPGTISYAYQWQRADNASGLNLVDIPGATGSTYVVQAADNGKYLCVKVTATDNGEGLPASQSVVASSAFVQVTNSAPVIAESDPQARTMDEDGSPAGWPGLTLHATDADGDSLTWRISTPAAHGTAIVVGSNTSAAVSYSPNPNWNPSDNFVVEVSDGLGGTDTITVNVTINPRNDPPVNTALPTIDVTAHVGTANHGNWNDSADRTPGAITYAYQWQRADNPSGLNLTDIPGATGSTYVVQAADNGKYLRVKVTATDDGEGLPASQSTVAYSAYVQVTNAAPVITESDPQTRTMDEDGSPAGWPGLMLHATDADGDSLTWRISTPAAHGTANVVGANTSAAVSYSPDANWNGNDSVVVQVSDGLGGADTITVNVTVNPRNDPPVNTALPTISGTAHVGKTLTANLGSWNDSADRTPGTMTYAYQWQRADNASGLSLVDIPGATSGSYVVRAADNGKCLRVKVTATDNGEGLPASQSTVAYSAYVQVYNDAVEPVVTNVAAVPTVIKSGVDTSLVLTATADDSSTGGSNIVAARYALGIQPDDTHGTNMNAADGSFDSSTEGLIATVDCSTWTPPTSRVINVRAKDAVGHWSNVASVTVPVISVVPPGQITDLVATPDDTFANAPITITEVSGGSAPGTSAANLTDGTTKSFWQSAGSDSSSEEWITADLGSVKTIGAVTVASGPVVKLFPQTLKIEASEDNSDWTAVAQAKVFKATANTRYIWQFEPLDARYVRVTARTVFNSKEGLFTWQVGEIEVPITLASTCVTLTWTAPADDGYTGSPAAAYDMRCARYPVTSANFASCTKVDGTPLPSAPGTVESVEVDLGDFVGRIYVAVKTVDSVDNWSALSNIATTRAGGARIISRTPSDGQLLYANPAPVFSFGSGALIKSPSIVVSPSPGFPSMGIMRPEVGLEMTARFGLPFGSAVWKVSAANWQKVKKTALSDGVLFWRLAGKTTVNGAPAVALGPTKSFYFDVGAIDNLAVSPSHDAGGKEGVWPVLSDLPTFSWDNHTNGMAAFYVYVSADPGVPPKDKRLTAILGGSKGTTASSYTATAAEWKKMRKLATLGNGTVYWCVKGYDSDKALSCGSGIKELVIDGGEWTLSDLDLSAAAPAVTWTHVGEGIAKYNLQFSVSADFEGTAKETIKMPLAAMASTSYALQAADLKRIHALADRNGATELYYRVRGEDADKAFITYGPSKMVALP